VKSIRRIDGEADGREDAHPSDGRGAFASRAQIFQCFFQIFTWKVKVVSKIPLAVLSVFKGLQGKKIM
jgi:hypothetical protein